MAFPPLVSSTPPPLDNFGESDEDEFGDFTAGGIDGIYFQITKDFLYFTHNTPFLSCRNFGESVL